MQFFYEFSEKSMECLKIPRSKRTQQFIRRQRFIPMKSVKVILGLVKFYVLHEPVSLQELRSGTEQFHLSQYTVPV